MENPRLKWTMTWGYPYDLGKPHIYHESNGRPTHRPTSRWLVPSCVDKAGTSNQQMLQKELLWNIQGSIYKIR